MTPTTSRPRDLDAFADAIAILRRIRHDSTTGCPTRIAAEIVRLQDRVDGVSDFIGRTLLPPLLAEMMDKARRAGPDTPGIRDEIADLALAVTMLLRRRSEERRITHDAGLAALEEERKAAPASRGHLRLVHSVD